MMGDDFIEYGGRQGVRCWALMAFTDTEMQAPQIRELQCRDLSVKLMAYC